MTDDDFASDLAAAYLTPSRPRPDLVQAVLARRARETGRRRRVLAAFGLAGCAAAAGIVGATGLAAPGTLEGAMRLAGSPWTMGAVGVALTLLATLRHAVREI